MGFSSIKAKDTEKAFADFYHLMMNSEHFHVFFTGQDQVDTLIKIQANNFYESLSMSDEDF